MKNKKFYFEEKVKEIFEDTHPQYKKIYNYYEEQNNVHFEYCENTISFPILVKLAELFGTTNIHFEGDKEVIEYSEWTTDTSCKGIFNALDVKYPPKENEE